MSSLPANRSSSALIQELALGLRRAASEIAAEGRPELAATYLRQALTVLPDDAARDALADLARLESTYDMESATAHFAALLADVDDIEIVAEAASAIVGMRPWARDEQTWQTAASAIAACEDQQLRLKLLARIGLASVLTLDPGDWREPLLTELHGHGSVTPGEKAALGVVSFAELWSGAPIESVKATAEALFQDDWVASLPGNGHCFWLGMIALVISDSQVQDQVLSELLAYGRRHSAPAYEGGTLVLRAHERLRAGDLAGAVRDGQAAFERYNAYRGGSLLLGYALAAVVEAERLRGNNEAVHEVLALAPTDFDAGTVGLAGLRFARAKARASSGSRAGALEEMLRIGAQYEAQGGRSPALLPWRSEAARLAHQLGWREQALALADAELADAAQAGPRALGRALSARAAVGPLAEAEPLLATARSELERVQAPVELIETLLVEGTVQDRCNSRDAARQTFARALELAERIGARTLAYPAREALIGVGGRPRRATSIGADGLTRTERAVAIEAANGHSNREIAATVNLAPGTVKNHLAAVYRKLSVSSRSQLAEALGLGGSGATRKS